MLGRKNQKKDRQRPLRSPAEEPETEMQKQSEAEADSMHDVDDLADLEMVSDFSEDSTQTSDHGTTANANRVPYADPEAQPPAKATATRANVGRSVRIQGELTGDEDLTIDGTVEGSVDLRGHALTIDEHGQVLGEVTAATVVIYGSVVGNVMAEQRIEVQPGGLVEGDLIAPKVVLSDGARFKGSIDMLTDPCAGRQPKVSPQGGEGKAPTEQQTEKESAKA